jgi:HSP20 family protein
VLNISVEQRSEDANQQKSYSKREYNYASWVRSFTLPESANAENIEATYTDGVLKIDIAKREEAKMVRRQIEIK